MKTILFVTAVALFLNLGLTPLRSYATPLNITGEVVTAYKNNKIFQEEM